MAYRNPDEIENVPDWKTVWWDRKRDTVYLGGITGSIVTEQYEKRPRLDRRHIQNIYGKNIHKNCGGSLEVTSGECGHLQARLRCVTCGKEFCADY